MSKKTLQLARKVLSAITVEPLLKNNFNPNYLKPLTLVSAHRSGKCHFNWTVDESQLNRDGVLHPGCIAGILDVAKGMSAMVAQDGVLITTTQMSFSFVGVAKENEVLDIHTEVLELGEKLAFIGATILNQNGEIVTKATQTGSVVVGFKEHAESFYGKGFLDSE